MIILGIDPGTAALGYGVVERTGARLRAIDFGCLETSADDPLPVRLQAIYRLVADLVALHQPSLVSVERLFFSRNAQTAFAVGQARGVVLLAVAEAGVHIVEATPSAVKVAVCGHGRADKEQVGRMVATILSLDAVPRPDDAADALATAIWGASTARSGEALTAGLHGRRAVSVGPGLPEQAGISERAGILDRAAIAPIARGQTPYERAVREALRAEAIGRGSARRRPVQGA